MNLTKTVLEVNNANVVVALKEATLNKQTTFAQQQLAVIAWAQTHPAPTRPEGINHTTFATLTPAEKTTEKNRVQALFLQYQIDNAAHIILQKDVMDAVPGVYDLPLNCVEVAVMPVFDLLKDKVTIVAGEAVVDVNRLVIDAENALSKEALILIIDSGVDSIYAKAIGNRQSVYDRAYKEASAFKELNYTGTVPPMVLSEVDAKLISPQAATDNILAQATAWLQLQVAIRRTTAFAKAANVASTSYAARKAIFDSWVVQVATFKSYI